MRLQFQAEQNLWAGIPAEFPTEAFATLDAWVESIVDRYAEGRPDAPDEYARVRVIASEAQKSLAPTATSGALFWPLPMPMATSVQFDVSAPLAYDIDPLTALLGDIPVSTRPYVEPVEVSGIGSGIAVRFLVSTPDSEQPVAGIGYLLSGKRGSVRVLSAPTTTTMVGLLDAPLRELVQTLELTD